MPQFWLRHFYVAYQNVLINNGWRNNAVYYNNTFILILYDNITRYDTFKLVFLFILGDIEHSVTHFTKKYLKI